MPQIQAKLPVKQDYTFRNAEATATITKGGIGVYNMNGTGDGVELVLPSTGGDAKSHTLIGGVALEDVLAGKNGKFRVSGFCETIKILRQSRAATTASFASAAAVAIGDRLHVVAAQNLLERAGAGQQDDNGFIAAAGQTLASKASSASSTDDTDLQKTDNIKGFVRFM